MKAQQYTAQLIMQFQKQTLKKKKMKKKTDPHRSEKTILA